MMWWRSFGASSVRRRSDTPVLWIRDAEGVLPVCLGKATRLCSLLTEESKTYEAVLLLGVSTDTQDTSGQVLSRRPVTCSEAEVIRCLEGFLGPQMQIPPMYSALKRDGKKLYELPARA